MNYSTLIKLANQLAEAEMLKELEGGDAMDGSELDGSELDGIDPEVLEALIAEADAGDEGVDPAVLEALMQDTEDGIDPELLQALLEQEGGLEGGEDIDPELIQALIEQEGGLDGGEDLDPELVQALIEQEGAEKEAAFNEKVAYLHQVYDAFMQKEAELNYREALLDAAEGNGMDKTASLVKEAQLEQAIDKEILRAKIANYQLRQAYQEKVARLLTEADLDQLSKEAVNNSDINKYIQDKATSEKIAELGSLDGSVQLGASNSFKDSYLSTLGGIGALATPIGLGLGAAGLGAGALGYGAYRGGKGLLGALSAEKATLLGAARKKSNKLLMRLLVDKETRENAAHLQALEGALKSLASKGRNSLGSSLANTIRNI